VSATSVRVLGVCCVLLLAGCATKMFTPADVQSAVFLSRSMAQEDGSVRVSAAIPDADETKALVGLDLYTQGIQPVWLKVENKGPDPVRLTIWSVDPDYFSPLEVAWMNRGGYSKQGKAAMERWFHEQGIQRRIPPGESRSGFVFTQLQKGTKGFNVDVFSGALDAFSFTFFVPMPGFTPDYMAVDFQDMYAPGEMNDVEFAGLRPALEKLPRYSTDASGMKIQSPFNAILIGTGDAVRRALMRARWQETEVDASETEFARRQHYLGRPPDGIFLKPRADGTERKELRLWLTPIQIGEDRVWIGQTGTVVVDRRKKSGRYLVSPDIDSPFIYLTQDFWYSQSLSRLGYVNAFEPTGPGAPHTTDAGYQYYTGGLRGVLWLSEDPIGLDEVVNLPWERMSRD
jgi:hypothetical protein